ncbi:MAG: MBL fold metallo-hydrolase [Gammaproteobacteria bacterium]
MIFRQLFDKESSTYTYLIADATTRETILIDTVLEQHERDLKLIKELELTLKYCIDTHIHADHVTGMGKMKEATQCQIGMPHDPDVQHADFLLKGGDSLLVGPLQIKVLATPGHTDHHLTYWVGDKIFTGDTLLIRGCGRTDFQSGSSKALYHSIHDVLFKLPKETFVYPGHDYNGYTVSTIGEELAYNPRFKNRTEQDFESLMKDLNLAPPKKIDISVPANKLCGIS